MAATPLAPHDPAANLLQPLPFGWTEHVAPGGKVYYYHAATGQSTYSRPIPYTAPQQALPPPAPTKKEKPLYKIPVPNSPWTRVKTNHGNIFFTRNNENQDGSKISVWTIPDDISDTVAEMDWDALEEEAARDKEIARLQKEMQLETTASSLKRKVHDETAVIESIPTTDDAAAAAVIKSPPKKRTRHSTVHVVPVDQAIDEIAISAPLAPGEDEAVENDEDGDVPDDDNEDAFSSASAEEEWQREMAEGLAKLAEEEAKAANGEAETGVAGDDEVEDVGATAVNDAEKPLIPVPAQVNLSPEEARTLFKTLLTDKNPSPLAPFSSVMPVIINDPRYALLPSQSDRESAFNEWCREVARMKRLAKSASTSSHVPATSALVSDEQEASLLTPASREDEKQATREAYNSLLKAEATSTRTTWDDFRRKWKKDRRFFGFAGDREREKVFRAWMKDLGERKRAQARKAELDFMELLKTNASVIPITVKSQWKDVKRPLVKDPRYDAVGSSSLREELYNTFLKALSSGTVSTLTEAPPSETGATQASTSHSDKQDRKTRAEKALKEREEQAKAQKSRVEHDIGRSKAALDSAEAGVDLMSFYVDAVRDPLAEFNILESTFAQHPRYSSSPLSIGQKRAMFSTHVGHLRDKFLTSLHALFATYAPLLSSKFSSITDEQRSSLDKSLPATKLGLSCSPRGGMEREFEAWQSRRTTEARAAFQALLEENSFIEFWGKVGKIDKTEVGQGVEVVDEDLEMGEMGGTGGVADDEEGGRDLKTLAKGIGEEQIERVLKNDQRFRAFDHMPEQRMKWVQDYLATLTAPSLSVHVQQQH